MGELYATKSGPITFPFFWCFDRRSKRIKRRALTRIHHETDILQYVRAQQLTMKALKLMHMGKDWPNKKDAEDFIIASSDSDNVIKHME